MKSKRTYLLAAAMLLVGLSVSIDADAQCAMCKAVVEGNGERFGGIIGQGINRGILYLMGIPYICLFVLFRTKIVSFFKEFRALYQ